jgi:serine protease SohB
MDNLFQYLLFLAETITIVIAILIVLGFILSKSNQNNTSDKGKINLKNINKHYDEIKQRLTKELTSKSEMKKNKEKKKKKKNKEQTKKPRVFVIDFKGDIQASQVTALREEITALLLIAKSEDEVCLRLESPGGMVPNYGLATAQLERLKAASIRLTICVDKMAASGGYMMAVVADRILAAPFAVIGSIGVVCQIPNFNRLLDKNSIDYEQITAGEHKRTLTVFGKNTDDGREKMQQDINITHDLFKQHIQSKRQQVNIDQVSTGEHWYASQAIEMALIDTIQTSDDYLMSLKDQCQLMQIQYKMKTPKLKQLCGQAANFISQHAYLPLLLKKFKG